MAETVVPLPQLGFKDDPSKLKDDFSLPKVSVIVSHLNSVRTIGRCLSAISNQDYPKQLFEIIVVDAGSSDGSLDAVRKLAIPNLKLIVAKGCSESEGHNIGVGNSTGEVLLFTNSDIYVPANWIERHVTWLNSGYDLVGGRVFWGGDKFTFAWNMPSPQKPTHVQQQGMGLGFSNCSVRKDFLISIGGLKNLTSQHDTEFAFRATKAGMKMILDPEIVVYHDHPLGSLRASFSRSFGYALNHAIVMRTFYGKLVSGSGSSSIVTPTYVMRELLSINGILAYRELYPEALKHNIRINLLEFVFIRFLGSKLGAFVGVLRGSTIRNVSYSKIPNLHKIVDKPSKSSALFSKEKFA